MPITTLPKRGSGEALGPEKRNRPLRKTSDVYEVDADEINAIRQFVEEAGTSLGLGTRFAVFDPDGEAGGNVFTTAASLLDAIDDGGGPVIVDVRGDLDIPGTRTLEHVHLIGRVISNDYTQAAPRVTFEDGSDIITSRLVIESCIVDWEHVTGAAIRFSGSGGTLDFRGCTFGTSNGGGRLWRVQDEQFGIILVSHADGVAGIDSPFGTVGDDAVAAVVMVGKCTYDAAAFAGTGTLALTLADGASSGPDTMTDGGLNFIKTRAAKAASIAVTPAGGIALTNLQAVLEALDARITALEP